MAGTQLGVFMKAGIIPLTFRQLLNKLGKTCFASFFIYNSLKYEPKFSSYLH